MIFPEDGYRVQDIEVQLSWNSPMGAEPSTCTLRFSNAWGDGAGTPDTGISKACFEQAIADAVAAFEARVLDDAASVNPATYRFTGYKV